MTCLFEMHTGVLAYKSTITESVNESALTRDGKAFVHDLAVK